MKILYSLLILGLVATGCKKDRQDGASKPKVYLLSKARFTSSSYPERIQSYIYDDKNRVIEMRFEGLRFFKYIYDDKNRVSTVLEYGISPNVLYEKDVYTYHYNFITAQRYDPDGFNSGSYSFTLNSSNHVVSLTSNNLQYTYYSNGNVKTYKASGTINQTGSYTYDNKKHPLSMIAGENVHLMYLAMGFPITHINNIIHDDIYIDPYTYTYNDDGFPVTQTVNSDSHTNIVSYEYIIK
jgi:hypothetical protein